MEGRVYLAYISWLLPFAEGCHGRNSSRSRDENHGRKLLKGLLALAYFHISQDPLPRVTSPAAR